MLTCTTQIEDSISRRLRLRFGIDVFEIIGPLLRLKVSELLMFTRMTGDLVKAMRACPQPIIAMSSDLRLGTARSKTAFLFNRGGLAGCGKGACAMLPRSLSQGRASALLYAGRFLRGEEGERWGFSTGCVALNCWRSKPPRWSPNWPPNWPPAPALPMASPRPCCSTGGR
jgi:hypothetical protein